MIPIQVKTNMGSVPKECREWVSMTNHPLVVANVIDYRSEPELYFLSPDPGVIENSEH